VCSLTDDVCAKSLSVYRRRVLDSPGTIFQFDDTWGIAKGWMEYKIKNQPIPESYFPKSLKIDRASGTLPDLFHANRGIIVVSERARAVLDRLAPGEVEFVSVTVQAAPTNWLNLLPAPPSRIGSKKISVQPISN
jgi:hypothetical protein